VAPERAALAAPPERTALPCLYSNNSIEGGQGVPVGLPEETPQVVADKVNILQSNHRKTAALLAWTVKELAEVHGLEKLGFLTLTFADHVTDPKEAQRRLNSLLSNVINDRYGSWVRVFERQVSGRIHYHLLVVLGDDIRTGFDFAGIAQGDYHTACPALKSEWAFWRECARSYGFGRTELLPVKSTSEGIARYVGKYISKHIEHREERDKGVRLVAISKGARVGSTRFAWATDKSFLWRRKLKLLASVLGVSEVSQMASKYGARWAYKLKDVLARFQLNEYPSFEHALADGRGFDEIDVLRGSDWQMWRRADHSPAIPCRCEGVSAGKITLGQALAESLLVLGGRPDRAAASKQRFAKAEPLQGSMTRWPSADEASSAHAGRRGKVECSSHPQDFPLAEFQGFIDGQRTWKPTAQSSLSSPPYRGRSGL
jgi:hypothetical protein